MEEWTCYKFVDNFLHWTMNDTSNFCESKWIKFKSTIFFFEINFSILTGILIFFCGYKMEYKSIYNKINILRNRTKWWQIVRAEKSKKATETKKIWKEKFAFCLLSMNSLLRSNTLSQWKYRVGVKKWVRMTRKELFGFTVSIRKSWYHLFYINHPR